MGVPRLQDYDFIEESTQRHPLNILNTLTQLVVLVIITDWQKL